MSKKIGSSNEKDNYGAATPLWSRLGKLSWFCLAAGLGCGLTLLLGGGFSLAQSLAKLLGGLGSWKLLLLEGGMALILFALILYRLLPTMRDDIRRQRATGDQESAASHRFLPMGNIAFWVLGILGLLVGTNIVMAIRVFFIDVSIESVFDRPNTPWLLFVMGSILLFNIFFLKCATEGPDTDDEFELSE